MNENRNIIGSAEINFENKEISDFSIYEEYRNQGFGFVLLNFAVQKLKVNKLFVEKNNNAKRFYIRNGFYIFKEINDNSLYLMIFE